ncbi:c2h2 type zinc finger transcription factor family-related [Anaeramoeba flamelloides]|uniref:C2h2 type zinc finger transcription factor family-related n=1 Tax=Anaeramoeba flamelloides TaxID=1746091 RepID=A0AAV7YNX8_9EUKA|nr:c2h2 type zinc finger transcription factor family-related [Anaeramoeba flamelloides]
MFHIHYNCLQCGKLFRTKNSLDKHISCYHVNFYKTVRKEKRKRNRVEYIQEQIDKKEKEKEKENKKEKEKENEDGGETEFIEEGEINTSNNFINSRGLEDIIHHNKDNLKDLEKLRNGIYLGGKKIQGVVSCFVGDTRESFPAKGMLQPGALNSCSFCKSELGDQNYSNGDFQYKKRERKDIIKIQEELNESYFHNL